MPAGDLQTTEAYVNDGFYKRLISFVEFWELDGDAVDEPLQRSVERFLYREARLLDLGDYDRWLELFSPACLYWVPIVPSGGNPRREVSWAFDDRRRLEDRVYWLRTGAVWSQIPPSRTCRQITNVEAFRSPDPAQIYARSTFLIVEAHPRRRRTLAGWNGHLLAEQDGELRIEVKQVNLVDGDQPQEKMTILL